MCLPASFCLAQNDASNKARYWYYRYRLITDFLVRGTADCGNNAGYSMPAVRIADPSTNTNIEWGDGTTYLGYYIAVLATEYNLLIRDGKPVDQTLEELYNAMMAYERLDRSAEKLFYPHWGNCSEADFNGLFSRDDVGEDLFTNHPSFNKKYNFTDLDDKTKLNKFNSTYLADHEETDQEKATSRLTYPSQDQVAYLFMGFALVKKCLDKVVYKPNTINYNFSEMAKLYTKKIITWIENSRWNGELADKSHFNNGNSFQSGSQWGIAKAAEAICGEKHESNMKYYTDDFSLLQNDNLNVNILDDARPLIIAAWHDMGDIASTPTSFFITQALNRGLEFPIDIPDNIGELILDLMYIKGKDYNTSFIQTYAAIGSSWQYGLVPVCNTIKIKKSIGKCLASGLIGMCFKTVDVNCCTYTVNLPEDILPKPVSQAFACLPAEINQNILNLDITELALAKHGKNFNQQIYYLLHRFLHNKNKSLISRQTFLDILNSAPCDLPHYLPYFDPSNRLKDSEGIEGWWASNKWIEPQAAFRQVHYSKIKIKGQTDAPFYDYGIFNGLDYMLLYNLYNLAYNSDFSYESSFDKTLSIPVISDLQVLNDLNISSGISGNNISIQAGNAVTLSNGAFISSGNVVDIKCAPYTPICGVNLKSAPAPISLDTERAAIKSETQTQVSTKINELIMVADSIRNAHAYIPIADYVNNSNLKSAKVDRSNSKLLNNSTSDAIEVSSSTMSDQIYVFPNPSAEEINVMISLPQDDLVQISLFDMSGRLVKKWINSYPKGNQNINFTVGQFGNGIYNLRVETSGYYVNKKVIIKKN